MRHLQGSRLKIFTLSLHVQTCSNTASLLEQLKYGTDYPEIFDYYRLMNLCVPLTAVGVYVYVLCLLLSLYDCACLIVPTL